MPIQKFIGFHNPEYKKNKCTVLYRNSFIFAQPCEVQEEKCRRAGRKCPIILSIWAFIIMGQAYTV